MEILEALGQWTLEDDWALEIPPEGLLEQINQGINAGWIDLNALPAEIL